MRRSRDGGGIRLSCSHVSQSDTRSRSWQVLAANLFLDSAFRVVMCELTPLCHLALEFAHGTRSLLARQTERWPVRRAASALRPPELGDARSAGLALARNPSGPPGPHTKPGAARATDRASTRSPGGQPHAPTKPAAARPVDRSLAGIASDLRIAHTKPGNARPAGGAPTRTPSEHRRPRHPR